MEHVIYRDSGQVTVLDPKQMILYSWDDPLGVRKLFWKPYTGLGKPMEATVDKVACLSYDVVKSKHVADETSSISI